MSNHLKNDYLGAKFRFIEKIIQLGGKVLGEYINSQTSIECECPNGHICNPHPSSIMNGQGMCRICTGRDPETSKQNFYANIERLEGKVIGEYVNSMTKIECICSKGHTCYPTPSSIQQGQGMCLICVGLDPETSKQNFYANIKRLDGEVIGEYVNSATKIECRCSRGHRCFPRPVKLQQGQGMCLICAKQDPETSKQNFYANIERLEGKVIGEYVNSATKIECICSKGHTCFPMPVSLQQGQGMCLVCVGLDPETSKRNFYANIKRLDGEVIGEYVNSATKIECRCSRGHRCFPTPASIQQGQGMCLVCVGLDPETSKQNFYANIKRLDGEVIGEYVNSVTKIECICSYGHKCFPIPASIQQGQGMCLVCVGLDSETSKQKFYANVEILKGTVIGDYVNSVTKIEI